ncbi:hypothetical protein [Cryptosporangium minutisporangium]|uniref:Uncharacterized protein n=1 Tax=Cryptosporangium minutisporangium TaxID=113569 RepID=A0ABP6T0V2_9ACTN
MTTTAVLLPLRLETRFLGTTLRVLVVPDEPWFDRHDPIPTAAELDDLERFYAAAGGDLDQPPAQAPWRLFAGRHGPGRAAWLVRTFPRAPGGARGLLDRPSELREEFWFTALPDFPSELQVWIARGDSEPALAATLPIDAARLRLDPPDPNPPAPEPSEPDGPETEVDPEQRWWESWDEAKRAGLGVEIDLGERSDDIEALYVVGLADTTAAALFARHRDAGQLGLLAPGTPTNSVDGVPTADLGRDPLPWLRLLRRSADETERIAGFALTGDRELLGALPGDNRPYQFWARQVLTALWPALAGHTLTHVLDVLNSAQTPRWVADNVDPIGPFPALRVGSQPYGLLPATSLRDWVPAGDDPPFEAVLGRRLSTLRARWAAAAVRGGRGAVDGADTDQLLSLLGQPPASSAYALRPMHAMELWLLGLLATGHGQIPGPTDRAMGWRRLVEAWHDRYPLAAEFALRPRRYYGARGWAHRTRLPLVTPRGLPGGVGVATVLRRLVDLARQAPTTFATTAAVEASVAAPLGSLLLRLAVRSLQVALGDLGRQKLDIPPEKHQAAAVPAETPQLLSDWIRAVAPEDLDADTDAARDLRRLTEALIRLSGDALGHLEQLVPAAVDCTSHRIDPWVVGLARARLRRLPEQPPLLGAYGWVDGPRPGQPGPTAGGLLHAPSYPQALTAALIRDRMINDPEPDRWHLDITSARARRAARLADEVRGGAHPAEALGREAERVVDDPLRIRALRQRYPLRGEHAGRRTCDGLRVLADLDDLEFPDPVRHELLLLRESVDVYADLLVAEAVQHVVDGRTGQAGAALDAAAGLARPPTFDVLRTRREGRPAESTCLIAIPDAPFLALPDDPATVHPALLADPATAAFLAARTGTARQWRWRLDVAGTAREITLADLDLEPADALALPLGVLERLVRQAVPDPGATIIDRDGSVRYEHAARLAALLGRSPATAADAAEGSPRPDPDGTAAADLRSRLADLRTAAQVLAERLRTDAGALPLAARWGIAPEPDSGAADALADRRDRAREHFLDRLAAAPDDTASASLDHLALAAALAALTSSTGQIAVLGRLRRDAFAPLQRSESGATGLDATWLPFVAPVRPPLARLEAFQLGAGVVAGLGPPLTGWTNRPTDPWQTDPEDMRRLVAAYTPHDLDPTAGPPGRTMAAGLLDRFSETIPDAEHTTTAAFGFDAPGARAPQAILLAVPPDPDRDLDPATLIRIVAETRELTRARMATPDDLDDVTGLVPLPLLPASGDTAVRLER